MHHLIGILATVLLTSAPSPTVSTRTGVTIGCLRWVRGEVSRTKHVHLCVSDAGEIGGAVMNGAGRGCDFGGVTDGHCVRIVGCGIDRTVCL